MGEKLNCYKGNLIIIFVALLTLAWAVPCFSKNNKEDAVNQALGQGEKETTVKKAKALEEDVKSFKRFHLSYASMWLTGKYKMTILDQTGTIQSLGFSDKAIFESRMKTRLDVYTADFCFTPKTYIEASYATGDFAKDQAAYANMFDITNFFGYDVSHAPLHLTGKGLNMWNVDLYQNIYTHKNTGMTVDLFAGFISYQEKIKLKYEGEATGGAGASDPIAAFDRRLTGPRVGVRYKAPFTIPDLPNNPFTFELTASYAQLLTLKGSGVMGIPLFLEANTTSRANKGFLINASTGVSYKITQYLSLAALFNYMLIKQDGGSYADVPEFKIGKIVNTSYGPSLEIRGSF